MFKNKSKVAVATDELAGLTRSGGIGTCASGLIKNLVSIGFEVHIIITDPKFDGKVQIFDGNKVFSIAKYIKKMSYAPVDQVTIAYATHEVLCKDHYDAVHFNDWRGNGFFFAMARRQGLVESTIVTHLHGPTKWVRRHNLSLATIEESEIDALEKFQIENSDYAISPSEYLIKWYRDNGYSLPESQVLNWTLPEWFDNSLVNTNELLNTRAVLPGKIDELIFFGRHERRKGFDIFLNAIALEPRLSQVNITFVGRFDTIDHEFTGSMTFRLLAKHKGKITFMNQFSHYEAVAFLQSRPNSIVVMPSVIENCPCTVGECFTLGIPFVATSVGGTPELFADGLNATNLVPNTSKELSKKLIEICEQGLHSVVSRLNPAEIVSKWREVNIKINRKTFAARELASPLVTVCLIHHNRISMLMRAMKALDMQTYKNFEVVLVDDGSDEATLVELSKIESVSWNFPLKIIRSKNVYLGAARNLAAKEARGDYLIFHDDDNISEPSMIEIYVKTAEYNKYDILTAQYLVFDDHSGPKNAQVRFFPMGVGGAFSYFRNRFGDANAIVRREFFQRIGGFSELKDVGWEDWEFFLKSHICGAKQGLVPFPLYRYRVSAAGMLSNTVIQKNHFRIISVMEQLSSVLTSEFLEIMKRDQVEKQLLDKKWSLLESSEFAWLHQEMMILEPNSDAAREKLVELCFSLGRFRDALELGIGQTKNFHNVISTFRVLAPKLDISVPYGFIECVASVLHSDFILLTGWVDLNKLLSVEGFSNNGVSYDLQYWSVVDRPDVNEFLGRRDNVQRGFISLASAVDNNDRSNLNPTKKSESNSSSVFGVSLSSDNLRYGDADLKFSGESGGFGLCGFLDLKVEGNIVGISIREASDSRYANRLTIFSYFGNRVFILDADNQALEEIKFDDQYSFTTRILTNSDKSVTSADLMKMRFFVSQDSINLRFRVYAEDDM